MSETSPSSDAVDLSPEGLAAIRVEVEQHTSALLSKSRMLAMLDRLERYEALEKAARGLADYWGDADAALHSGLEQIRSALRALDAPVRED